MENLFNDIQKHIADNFPELSLIDEDYGQLEAIETEEDTYPVTFPCVLINTPETEWRQLGGSAQQGTCNVIVRLAIDCYEDTHYGSGTEEKTIDRLLFAHSIHQFLQGFKSSNTSPLIRRSSRNYSRPHGIKVYEFIYNCTVSDIIAPPKPKPVPGEIPPPKGDYFFAVAYQNPAEARGYSYAYGANSTDLNKLCNTNLAIIQLTNSNGVAVDFLNRSILGVYFGNMFDLTAIPANFCTTLPLLNQPVELPNGITTINRNFMSICFSFNQPIMIPNSVTNLQTSFLSSCYSFNSKIKFSDNQTNLITPLYNCYSFNQDFIIPNSVTSINGFGGSWRSFNKKLVIPSSITSFIGTIMNGSYLWYANGELEYNSPVLPPEDVNSFSGANPIPEGFGIRVSGSNAAALVAAFPESNVSPYRRLILDV